MDNEHLVHLLVNPNHLKNDVTYIQYNKLHDFFKALHKLFPHYEIEEDDYIVCINKIEKVITDFVIDKIVEEEITKVINLVILGNEHLLSEHHREEIERRCIMHNSTKEEYLG